MTPRTYESLETKLRRLAGWAEEAQQRGNLARVRIVAAQLPDLPDLNRALEVIDLIGLEAGGLGAELAEAQRSEGQEPSQAVRLQRMVRELLRLVGLQNKWAMAKTEEVLAQTEEEKVECRVRQLRLTADINEVMAGVEKLSNSVLNEQEARNGG